MNTAATLSELLPPDVSARPARPAISCVVPAFNEAANLNPLLTGLTAQLAALTERWEIIVVDDGSRDTTQIGRAHV